MIPPFRDLTLLQPSELARRLAVAGIDSSEIETPLIPDTLTVLAEGVDKFAAETARGVYVSLGVRVAIGACKDGKVSLVISGSRRLFPVAAKADSIAPARLIAEEAAATAALLENPPARWNTGRRVLDFRSRPCVMGILNLTPDSFSDAGSFMDLDRAVGHALRMENEGADIIDIGGESTRPSADMVSAEEELRRVIPVIDRLAGRLQIPISIDTYKAAVAREALLHGAEIVNDISGLSFDDEMATVVADAGAGVVLMHTRGRPDEMQKNTSYNSLIGEVSAFLKAAIAHAEASGIAADRIVIDPGIGFGKDATGNMELLRRLGEFKCLGRPILIGTSRKGFIAKTLGREVKEDRTFGTAATVSVALMNGASIFRVHDVWQMRDVVDMTNAILKSPTKTELTIMEGSPA